MPTRIRVLLVFGILGFLTACSSSSATDQDDLPQTSAIIQADWDDIPAAVLVSLAKVEMAAVSFSETSSPKAVHYQILTARDRPAQLTIRMLESGKMEVSASVGRFGDDLRAAELVGRLAERLAQLHGVKTAPLNWAD